MDNVISFTPAQLLSLILGVCGAIITISAAIGIITKVIEKAKTPEREQDERIQALEEIVKQYGETLETFRTYFANDDRRFKAIEKSNKVTQSALLALMKHALNDGDKSTLKDAEKQLEEYLIDKDM